MKWNKDQQRAIDYPDKTLPKNTHSAVVSAAAGSGKTALLVERVAQIIGDKQNPIPADKIAILTFTNNAVNEFRQRMTQAVSDLISASKTKDPYLESQLILFRSAPIQTINSFCLSIIRDNTDVFGLPVSVSIIDDVKSNLLKAEAMDNTMEIFYSDNVMFPQDDREQLFKTFSFDDDKRLTKAIETIYSKLTSMADHNRFLTDCVNAYSSADALEKHFLPFFLKEIEKLINDLSNIHNKINHYASISADNLLNASNTDKITLSPLLSTLSTEDDKVLSDYLNGIEKLNEKVIDVIPSKKDYRAIKKVLKARLKKGNDISEKFITYIDNVHDHIYNEFQKVKSNISVNSLKDFLAAISTLNGADIKFSSFKADENTLYGNELQSLRNKYKTIFREKIRDGIKTFIPAVADSDIIIKQQQTISTFVRLVMLYEKEYTKTKRSGGYIDFADCEQMLLDTLMASSEFRNTLKDRYKCIIVDEFQDTNDIQYEIFRLISDDEKNLFFVGDIKQSIYGFRGGNPRIMMRLSDKTNTTYDTIPLNRNYRSRRSIIRTVNAMFAGLMTKEYGDVDYDRSAMLVYGADYPDPENKDYISELHIIDGVDSDDEKNTVEAEYTANIIKKMVDEHFQVRESSTTTRDCNYGDFIVLLRSFTHADAFKKAFEEHLIPVNAEKEKSYLATEEISLIISLLKVIDNPMQDLELLKVLSSPLYMMSAEELAKARLGILGFPQSVIDSTDLTPIHDRYKYRSLYACIKACSSPYSEDEEKIRNKLANGNITPTPADELEKLRTHYNETCSRFINDISIFRDYKSHSSIESLINKIYNDTDFFSVIATYERCDKKIANIRKLLKYAADFERSGGGTLNEFLRYTDKVTEKGINFDDAKTSDSVSDSIRLMTYHGSKGLEAPIVILPQLGKKENTTDRSTTLLFNRDAGIGVQHIDIDLRYSTNTTARACISLAEQSKQRSEELRLLYVAMTRAREKLIMIGQCSVEQIMSNFYPEYFSPNWAMSDGSGRAIAWILSSMLRYSEKVDFTQITQHKIKNRLKIIIPKLCKDSEDPSTNDNEEDIIGDDTEDDTEMTDNINTESTEIVQEIQADEDAVKWIEQAINAQYSFEADTNARSKFTVTEIAHRIDEQTEETTSDEPVSKDKFRPDYRFHLNKPAFMRNKDEKLTGPLLGNAYHNVMELFPLDEMSEGKIPDAEYISCQLDQLAAKKMITEDERRSVNDEAILRFFLSDLGRRMLSSNGIEREYSIFAELAARDIGVDQNGDTIIQGRTDMFFYEEDGIVIVDYKSDKKETLIKRMDDYFTQLSIYRTVLPMLTGKQVKQIYIYSFSYGEAIEELEKETWLKR